VASAERLLIAVGLLILPFARSVVVVVLDPPSANSITVGVETGGIVAFALMAQFAKAVSTLTPSTIDTPRSSVELLDG
jgi:hypothetical protein